MIRKAQIIVTLSAVLTVNKHNCVSGYMIE
jgi:hypothetical protein